MKKTNYNHLILTAVIIISLLAWRDPDSLNSGPGLTAQIFDSQQSLPAVVNQSAYRWFDSYDSTRVGPPLTKEQNQPVVIFQTHAPIRLRLLLQVAEGNLIGQSGKKFKLQYAEKKGVCDTAFIGENYRDVTASTLISFFDLQGSYFPQDGELIIADSNDPFLANSATLPQTFEEANPFTIFSNKISAGAAGLWDFSLIINSEEEFQSFCLRVVEDDGSLEGIALQQYGVLPEISIGEKAAAAELTPVVIKEEIKNPFEELIKPDKEELTDDSQASFLGGVDDLAIIPSRSQPALGAIQSDQPNDRWDISSETLEANQLVVGGRSLFNKSVWFKGEKFIFGNKSVTINAANNRLSFGRNPESGIVFGEGDNSSFSFYDANNLNDLAGRKKLFSVIDKGESANIEVTGGADFNVDGTSESFRIRSVNNPDFFLIDPAAEKITISGRLDIGRTIIANSADSRGMAFFRYDDDGSLAPFISFRRHRGAFDLPAVVQTGDFLGKFDFQGYDGLARQQSAIFAAVVDGPITPGNVPTAFIISTGANGGNSPERLRVTSAGFVGINTTTPSRRLAVQGNLRVTGKIIRLRQTDGGGASSLAISAFSPSPGSASVSSLPLFQIIFSKEIELGSTPTIKIFSAAGLQEAINLNNSNIAGKILQFSLSLPLSSNQQYYIELANDAVRDLSNNQFAGFSDPDIWQFTVGS